MENYKITIVVGNITLRADSTNEMQQYVDWVSELKSEWLKLWPEAAASIPKPAKKAKGTGILGSPDDMLEWLRTQPPHSEYHVAKHCGFDNAKALLKELTRTQKLSRYEVLYTSKSGSTKTMLAYFVDGKQPTYPAPLDELEIVYKYVKAYPGQEVKQVIAFCGVVRSRASSRVDTLIQHKRLQVTADSLVVAV